MTSQSMSPIELSLFASRIESVCEEMGAVLQRTAFSPNIKDRLDFSCAVFDAGGDLCAQAAHIPVHMGSMAYAMRGVVSQVEWQPGDMIIMNDPFLGGTHLPDVTLIAPLFVDDRLVAFVANRAHHADIGSDTPGSMPISTTLQEEGIIIPPTTLLSNGNVINAVMDSFLAETSAPVQSHGDFSAQISANRTGLLRLTLLVEELGIEKFNEAVVELNNYADRLAANTLTKIPDGDYKFTDVMDSDGMGNTRIPISAAIHVANNKVSVDFEGTANQVAGNINCPMSVTAAAVYYVFSCLMPSYTPTCQGRFRHIEIAAPESSIVNANRPAAVAAGNVETSTRIVDVVMGALAKAIPNEIAAASHGSMNNVAMGAHYDASDDKQSWDYYETIGGGMGAGSKYDGLDAIQTHMTNTRNTPVEVLENLYPIRVRHYGVRIDSGGAGFHQGGNGIVREFEFLEPATVTVLTERRLKSPWGLNGGGNAEPGLNQLNDKLIKDKQTLHVCAGDRLKIATAGGGGWGENK